MGRLNHDQGSFSIRGARESNCRPCSYQLTALVLLDRGPDVEVTHHPLHHLQAVERGLEVDWARGGEASLWCRGGSVTPTVGSMLTSLVSTDQRIKQRIASRKWRACDGVAERRSRPALIVAVVILANGCRPADFSTVAAISWKEREPSSCRPCAKSATL
jgi:hypothetical protein